MEAGENGWVRCRSGIHRLRLRQLLDNVGSLQAPADSRPVWDRRARTDPVGRQEVEGRSEAAYLAAFFSPRCRCDRALKQKYRYDAILWHS